MRATQQDLTLAVRQWKKAPAFAAAAILTLALGIGGTTAVFSLADAVLLRPLPFPNPQRLVRITADIGRSANADAGLSAPELADYRAATDIFDGVSALYPINNNLTGVERPVRIEGLLVSGNYFELLDVSAARGRVLQMADEVPGIGGVGVITDALWRREFGADPAIIGRVVRLDGDPVEIVGVLSPDFRHPGRGIEGEPELFMPAGFTGGPFAGAARGVKRLAGALARVRDDLSLDDARTRLDELGAALRARHPADYPGDLDWRPRLVPLHLDVAGPVRPALMTLAAAVAIVLVIACANVANLLMARGSGRRRELAVRTALGATRRRLLRQLLTESLALGAAGGAAGLLVAQWLIAAATRLMPAGLPLTAVPGIDARAFFFAIGVTFAAGALAGSWPAVALTRRSFGAIGYSARSVIASRGHARLRRAIVIGEVALALTLLVTAGLLTRSFLQAFHVDPGFSPDRVLAARIWMPLPNDRSTGPYREHDTRVRFYRALLDRLRATSGVEQAGFVSRLPLVGRASTLGFLIEGHPLESADRNAAEPALASPSYFDTIGARLVRGRHFTDDDTADRDPVLLVSESFARRHFPGEEAIGRRIRPGGTSSTAPWFTIVGVVNDIRSGSLDRDPESQTYRCVWQTSNLAMALVVRTAAADPVALESSVRAAVRSIDPDLPLFGVRPMADILAANLAPRRFAVTMVGGFASLAIALAVVGLYGVLAYMVQQRRGEIGLRMALGASPARVLRLVVAEGMALALGGIAIGLVGAMAAARSVSGLLFGIPTFDPVTFGGLAALLAGVTFIASFLPALRAARVDPVLSLRSL